MRASPLILLAVGSLGCHAPGLGGAQPTPVDSAVRLAIAKVVARSAGSVVSLKCLDATGGVVRGGSGFIVQRGRVATNAHVVRGCSRVEVRDRTGELLLTTRFAATYCHQVDVAVLPPISSGRRTLRLTRELPAVGQRIVVISPSPGSTPTVSDGSVNAIRGGDVGALIQFTGQDSAFSSGGPLLNLRGEVVGVELGPIPGQQVQSFAVTASGITAALDPFAYGFESVALTDIRGDQIVDSLREAQHQITPSEVSAAAVGIRHAKATVDSSTLDTAAA